MRLVMKRLHILHDFVAAMVRLQEAPVMAHAKQLLEGIADSSPPAT